MSHADTVAAIAKHYFASKRFAALPEPKQKSYRSAIEQFAAKNGNRTLAGLQPEHLAHALAKQAALTDVPTANNWLQAIKALCSFGAAWESRRDEVAFVAPLRNEAPKTEPRRLYVIRSVDSAERQAKWNAIKGLRPGDWCLLPDGSERRFADNGYSLESLPGEDGFHLTDEGHVNYSGGHDFIGPLRGNTRYRVQTEQRPETKPGSFWFFHHNVRSGGGIAANVSLPCRVFKLIEREAA